MGGQVGDTGEIRSEKGRMTVSNTVRHVVNSSELVVHQGRVIEGTISVNDAVEAIVDEKRRLDIARNHTATHLLQAALRQVLGTQVQQSGSLVSPERLRFDFTHVGTISKEQLNDVQRIVNEKIRHNLRVRSRKTSYSEAIAQGALAFFGEKYGDEVRVLDVGSSRELCGGTHVARTGDIGLFKIVMEAGVAAGVRRIEAITGDNALAYVQEQQALLQDAAGALKGSATELPGKIVQMLENVKALEKELARLKAKLASSQGSDLESQAVEVGGIKVLAAKLEGADPKALRDTVDQLKNKLGTAAVVLATVQDGKVSLVAGVTKDATDRIKACDLVNLVAEQVGGKGGGRPDMAQAGGTQPEGLSQALTGVPDWIRARLAAR
jgi:alanyl-tRNA synthetase